MIDHVSRTVTRHRRFRLRIAGAALTAVAAISVGACSSDGATSPSAATASSVAQSHNAADVTFSRDMIPHHRQAVEMASLAPLRASDRRVVDLAAQIEAAQKPQIDELTARLRSWGEAVPSSSDAGQSGMDHGSKSQGSMDHGSMSGMMSASDLAELTGLRGVEFDRQWLSMMIEHHTGAVAMATAEIAQGYDAASKALARNIITTQQAEIDRMRTILAG